MNCFNHTDQAACGFCAFCAKGLCHDCAAFSDNMMCCDTKNCQDALSTRASINDRAAQLYGLGKYKNIKKPPLSAMMYLAFGIIYSSMYFYTAFISWYFMLPGAIFIIWGLILIFRKNRINY